MVDYGQIRIAFRKRLNTVAGLPDRTNRAWENKGFKPEVSPEMTPWLRETLLPVSEILVATDQVELVAIMQYDVVVPANTGADDGEEMAKSLANAFKPATSMNDPVQVAIDRCERLGGRDMEGGWWQLPVQIRFRSYVSNS